MKRGNPTPAAGETKRCAIYTRKSTTMGLEQEFSSLDAQREACAAYVARQGGWVLVDQSYDDGGFTGANIERPAFQRLLADIDAGKIDVVVVYKVDRLSRSLLDFAKMMERFGKAGTSFVSVTQQFSTADAMGRLTLHMLLSFAEFERSMIAERTRDKVRMARRKGKWTGGTVPFGYAKKEKRLVVDEVEAAVVRSAFELFLQHRQVWLVARLLNERGAVRRPGRGRNSAWTKDAMARLLRNPVYGGFVACGEELVAGESPALVETAVWQRVQRILDGAERELTFHGTNPEYLLRGLLFCGRCGGRMCPGSTRKGNREWRYYRCSNRDKRGTCEAVALPAPAIEEHVVERVSGVLAGGRLAAKAKAALDARIRRERARLGELRAALPSKIAAASANAPRWADELTRTQGRAREIVAAKLDAEAEALARLEAQLAAVGRELAALDDEATDGAWVAGAMADFPRLWEVLTVANRGRLLRALVHRVEVDETAGRIEVELARLGEPRVRDRAEVAA